MRNSRFIGPFIAISLPYIIFECFRNGIIEDPFFIMHERHFYIVSTISLLSMIISIVVGIAGIRLRNIKVTFLAMSFISLAQMFFLHGLATPHFLLPVTSLPSVSAQLSILFATFWLWMSSLQTDHKLIESLSHHHRILLLIWVMALSIFVIVCMNFPYIMDFLPITLQPLNWIVTTIIVVLNIITIKRYFLSYMFSRFPLQLSIVYSAGWFMVSQLIMVLSEVWRLSWWMYHYVLFASMVMMLVGLCKQYAGKGNINVAIRGLFTNDPFERVTSSMSPSVKSFVMATEKKDIYTVGHTFRVTMYALKLGEELQLKPEQLRALAQGGLVHDVGKISIPDVVLNKPGKLTAEEREMIEKHPVNGYEMCRNLGFMKEELAIIRSHHEKWDGSGYPDRLKGEEINLLARIIAVVDVYDALTTDRSYRKAWTHSKANNFIINQKGIHFDAKCVDAWAHLCHKDPSVYQYPSELINLDTTSKVLSTF